MQLKNSYCGKTTPFGGPEPELAVLNLLIWTQLSH